MQARRDNSQDNRGVQKIHDLTSFLGSYLLVAESDQDRVALLTWGQTLQLAPSLLLTYLNSQSRFALQKPVFEIFLTSTIGVRTQKLQGWSRLF
jgi:hypothetical protein